MLQVYITLTSLAVMFVPTLIIAICYITIVTVVWRKSSFTVSSRRSKAEDSCMELSTVVTKGQIKVFFLLTVMKMKLKWMNWKTFTERAWLEQFIMTFDSLLPENMMNCNSELPIFFFVLLTKSYSVTSSIII